jgi:hypothetical protein
MEALPGEPPQQSFPKTTLFSPAKFSLALNVDICF